MKGTNLFSSSGKSSRSLQEAHRSLSASSIVLFDKASHSQVVNILREQNTNFNTMMIKKGTETQFFDSVLNLMTGKMKTTVSNAQDCLKNRCNIEKGRKFLCDKFTDGRHTVSSLLREDTLVKLYLRLCVTAAGVVLFTK